MYGEKLSVIEKGDIVKDFVLNNMVIITSSSYSETLDSMINNVEIYDDKGKQIGEIKMIHGLRTMVYFKMYISRKKVYISWDYGSELEDLIGQSFSQEYIEVEVKRMVEDCLLINVNISSISDFSVMIKDDKLTANTRLGEVQINV